MLKFIALAVAMASSLIAAPDCSFGFDLRATQSTRAFSNKQHGCVNWVLTFAGSAPVTVQTSTDGTTWGSTGITISDGGPLPTTSSVGRVIFTGYAPFLRITASGTGAQATQGLLSGGMGTTASSGGGTIPPYLPAASSTSYTAVVPSEWTSTQIVGTRTDYTNRIAMKTLGGNVLANGQHFEIICRAYPAVPFSAKLTLWQPEGQYWANDANKYIGLAIRDSGTDRRIINIVRNRTNQSVFRCTDRTATCAGGAIQNEVTTHASSSLPVTFYLSDNGTTRTWGIWDLSTSQNITWGNTATTSTAVDWITTPDQLCFVFASGNGNYPDYVQLLGYDVSSP